MRVRVRARASWILVVAWMWGATSPSAASAEGITPNGLSSESFLANALTTNPTALRRLIAHALDETLYTEDSYVNLQLEDPHARAMLTEIVSCALGREATLKRGNEKWRGELGLCQPDPALGKRQDDPPTWGTDGPNLACQELVTACVAARVNALGLSVPIVLRGEPAARFPLDDKVPTGVTFRQGLEGTDPAKGTPISSFGGPLCAGRECQWAPAYVGRCTTGSLTVTIKDKATCDTATVRVCSGIHGCYGPESGYDVPASYGQYDHGAMLKEQIGACDSPGPTFKFDCPAGPDGAPGFYSVMTHRSPSAVKRSPLEVEVVGSGVYPATTKEVFPFLEGAFYGNLFEPDHLTWNCEVLEKTRQRRCSPVPPPNPGATTPGAAPPGAAPPGSKVCDLDTPAARCPRQVPTVPYSNVYACYALLRGDGQTQGNDNQGVAYLNGRICTDVGSDCFVNPPKPCFTTCKSTDGVFPRCAGTSKEYDAITTYLNGPCDLLGSPGSSVGCAQRWGALRVASASAALAEPATPAGSPERSTELDWARGASGRWSVVAGAVVVAIAIAVVVALLVRSRRRWRVVVRVGSPR